jgi:hypothetical protein
VAGAQRVQEDEVVLMARRIRPPAVEVAGIRGVLVDALQVSLDRLVAADTDVYDFALEREGLAGVLDGLRSGRDVCVQGWQIPREFRPARGKVFRLTGDQLIPESWAA